MRCVCYNRFKYVIINFKEDIMDNLNIGQRLKAARQNRNMTLDGLAEITGVSKPMLGQIERGRSSPTVNTLWKIATGMKIPFSSFFQ